MSRYQSALDCPHLCSCPDVQLVLVSLRRIIVCCSSLVFVACFSSCCFFPFHSMVFSCFMFFFFICYDFVLWPCQVFFLFKCPNLFLIVYRYGLVLLFKINKNCFRQKPELSASWVPPPHCRHHTPHGNFVAMSGLVAL